MKNFNFWSDNPASQVAVVYLRVRRQFPTIPASAAIAFARMTVIA